MTPEQCQVMYAGTGNFCNSVAVVTGTFFFMWQVYSWGRGELWPKRKC